MATQRRKTYTRKNVKSPKVDKSRFAKDTRKSYTRGSEPTKLRGQAGKTLKKSSTTKSQASTPKPKASTPRFKSTPRIPKPLTKTQKAKQVKTSTKAANQLKKARAVDAKNIKKTLKQIDKAKLTKTPKQVKALKGTRALQKGIGISKHASKLKNLKSVAKGGLIGTPIAIAADWGTKQIVDRAFKQIDPKTRGKNMTLAEYRERVDETLRTKGANIKAEKEAEKKSRTNGKKESGSTSKKSDALKAKKMSSIEKRNREIHGDETIDALKKRHEEFKAKRKAGTHRKPKLTRAEELRKRTGR